MSTLTIATIALIRNGTKRHACHSYGTILATIDPRDRRLRHAANLAIYPVPLRNYGITVKRIGFQRDGVPRHVLA